MEDRCKDCIYVSAIDKRLDALESKINGVEARLISVEKTTAVSEEQVKMIFNIMNEIKDDIKRIASKIDEIEKQPGKKWEEVTKTIVTVLTTAIVTFIISKIIG